MLLFWRMEYTWSVYLECGL